MNTAFLDAVNLAWKLHLVEQGFAIREVLQTYESERKAVAESLLAFDHRYAKLFSQRVPKASEVEMASRTEEPGDSQGRESDFIKTFKENCEFTSGYGVAYKPNVFNWSKMHAAKSYFVHPAGTKLQPGRLMINADVTRVVDANVVHLEHAVPFNGSFRIYVFAGNPAKTREVLQDFASSLESKRSFLQLYRRADEATVSHHEKDNPHSLFFTFCIIFTSKRSSIEITRDVPGVLGRYSEHVYADDRWDRRVSDAKGPAHAKMGLDEERGGVVVVRPDGYVGMVVSLVEGGTVDALNEYFGSFSTKKLGGIVAQL